MTFCKNKKRKFYFEVMRGTDGEVWWKYVESEKKNQFVFEENIKWTSDYSRQNSVNHVWRFEKHNVHIWLWRRNVSLIVLSCLSYFIVIIYLMFSPRFVRVCPQSKHWHGQNLHLKKSLTLKTVTSLQMTIEFLLICCSMLMLIHETVSKTFSINPKQNMLLCVISASWWGMWLHNRCQ